MSNQASQILFTYPYINQIHEPRTKILLLTFIIRQHVIYTRIPEQMVGLWLPLSSVPVTTDRWYRSLIPRADINSRGRAIVSLRIVGAEIRIPLVLMQPGVEARPRAGRIQDRWRRVTTVPMPVAGFPQSRRIRSARVQASIHAWPFSALPDRAASRHVTGIKKHVLVQKLLLDLFNRDGQVSSTGHLLPQIIILGYVRLYEKLGRVHHLLLIELAGVVLMVRLHVQAQVHGDRLHLRRCQPHLLLEREGGAQGASLHQHIRLLQPRRLDKLELAVVVHHDPGQATVTQPEVHQVLAGDKFVRLELEPSPAGRGEVFRGRGEQGILRVGHHLILEGVMRRHGETRPGERHGSR